MARRRRKSKQEHTFGVVLDFVDLVDTTFERLTGKPIANWLKEFQQQLKELPPGEQAVASPSAMSLADAYAVLGLKPTSSFDEVKKRYRNLARLFHPDAPGGYTEAMVLLNNAYDRIVKGEKIK